jgi:ppGpp synthetase/RelA/SpoT-type nucleotidyltranferase
MPVTAKFSEEFYAKLGHNVADKVDAAYRLEVRDLIDARLAQFELKLDQRMTELRGELTQQRVELAKQKAELIKWMFGFWAPTAVGVIALLLK